MQSSSQETNHNMCSDLYGLFSADGKIWVSEGQSIGKAGYFVNN